MRSITRSLGGGLLAIALAVSGVARAQTTVDGAAIANEKETANWLSYGRTYSEQRYSPLTQISAQTIKGLGVDWALELPTDHT